MSDDETTSIQTIHKVFNEYLIKLSSNLDYIYIQIQNIQSINIYKSKFNLENLQQYRLLSGNFTIEQMIECIIDFIGEQLIKIEENENELKLILISKIKSYPNVDLILKKENIFEKLINITQHIKNENKLLKVKYEEIKNKIELIEKGNNLNKNNENKNIEFIKKEDYEKLNTKIDLIEKENIEFKKSMQLILKKKDDTLSEKKEFEKKEESNIK